MDAELPDISNIIKTELIEENLFSSAEKISIKHTNSVKGRSKFRKSKSSIESLQTIEYTTATPTAEDPVKSENEMQDSESDGKEEDSISILSMKRRIMREKQFSAVVQSSVIVDKDNQRRFKCPQCNKVFKNRDCFRNHYNIHTGDKKYACTACNKTFRFSATLSRHRKDIHKVHIKKVIDKKRYKFKGINNKRITGRILHLIKSSEFIDESNGTKYKCPECSKVFNSRYNFKTHHSIHTGEKQHTCDLCGKSFRVSGSLSRHRREVHKLTGNSPISFCLDCYACNKVMSSPIALFRHLKDVHKIFLNNPCDFCGLKLGSINSLLMHHKEKHKDEPVKPGQASYKEKLARKLKDNELLAKSEIVDETNTKHYKCPICGNVIKRKWDFLKHQKIHTGEKRYCCEQCGKMFGEKGALMVHVNEVHLKIIKFHCPICKAKFTNKVNLTSHMNIHTDNRPYVCETCGKGFRQNGSLYKHKVSHTDIYPHACDLCDKKFRTAQILKIHYRNHTGERPYVCSLCNASYADSSSLRKHEKTHDRSKVYACVLCGNKYTLEKSYKNHMRGHKKKGEMPVVLEKKVIDLNQFQNI